MKTFKLLDTFLIDGFYVTQNYFANKQYYAQFGLLGHEGVDLGHKNKLVKVRTPISGTAFVAWDEAYGWFAVIEDYKQGCGVYICHMVNPQVVSGEEVTAGDVIGEMDDTGNANGEHVHFNFIILNEQGSNKYRNKAQNYGYLDPRYPRDTGAPVKFAGVEDYAIQWVLALDVPVPDPGNGGTMPNMYKGYDLANPESMKVAVDQMLRILNGEFVDKTKYETDLKAANESCDARISDGRTAEKLATIKSVSRELSLPESINEVTGLVSAIKGLINQSNSGNPPSGSPKPTLPAADKLKANGLVIEWEEGGIKYTLNHEIKE